MRKEGLAMPRKAFFALAFVFVLAAFVIATHGVTVDPTSVNESVETTFNFSIDNTATLATGNITSIIITLPSEFEFSESTGESSSAGIFDESGGVLNWTNGTGLIMNSTEEYFWFDATASEPGSYNIIVTAVNSTGSHNESITVEVNDTLNPSAEIIFPSGVDVSGSISLSANVDDSSGVSYVRFNVSNSTYSNGSLVATNVSATVWNATFNTAVLVDGDYNVSVYANDTTGKENNTEYVSFYVDTVHPEAFDIKKVDSTKTTIETNFSEEDSCDDNRGIKSCELMADDGEIDDDTVEELECGTEYDVWVLAIDNAGNEDSSEKVEMTTDDCEDSSSGTTGTTPPPPYWTNTIVADDVEFSEKKSLGQTLSVKQRVRIKIDGDQYYVGAVAVGSSSVTLNLSDNSKTLDQEVFSSGEEKMFDLTRDGYYDIKVLVESIEGSKAEVNMSHVSEQIAVVNGSDAAGIASASGSGTGELDADGAGGGKWFLYFLIIIIIGIAGGLGYLGWSEFNKRQIARGLKDPKPSQPAGSKTVKEGKPAKAGKLPSSKMSAAQAEDTREKSSSKIKKFFKRDKTK